MEADEGGDASWAGYPGSPKAGGPHVAEGTAGAEARGMRKNFPDTDREGGQVPWVGIAWAEPQVSLQRCERTLSFYNYKAAEGSGLGTKGRVAGAGAAEAGLGRAPGTRRQS